MSTTNNKSKFTTAILYVLVIAMAIPYFMQSNNNNTIMRIGSTNVTQKDLSINHAISSVHNNPYNYPYLQHHATYLTNPLPTLFAPILRNFGLTGTKQQIKNFIKSDTNSHTNQYSSTLKNLKITEDFFQIYVNNWLKGQQLDLLLEAMCEKIFTQNQEFVANIKNAFKQIRHGKYYAVPHQKYNVRFSDDELIDLEQFFIKNKFKSPLLANLTALSINKDDPKLTTIINQLKAGKTLTEAAAMNDLHMIKITIKDDHLSSSHPLNPGLNSSLITSVSSANIGSPLALEQGGQLIIFIVDSKSPQQTLGAQYFQDSVLKAWKNKELDHPIIQAWIEDKIIARTKLKAVDYDIKLGSDVSSTFNQIMHLQINKAMQLNHAPSLEYQQSIDDQASKTYLPIQVRQALFANQLNHKTAVVVESKQGKKQVYLVQLQKIEHIDSEFSDDQLNQYIKQAILHSLRQDYAQIIANYYR